MNASPDFLSPLGSDQLTLETDRLTLRPLAISDLPLAVEMFTDFEVVKYVCDVHTAAEIAENLPTETRRGAGGRIGIWVMRRKDTGEDIGTSVLLPMPIDQEDTDWTQVIEGAYPDGEVEVGYMLLPSAWGQGFATETCKRLVDFWFEQTDQPELAATTDPDNHASQHVLQKCGLKHEGLRYAYACQSSSFRISRAEWEDEIRSGSDSSAVRAFSERGNHGKAPT